MSEWGEHFWECDLCHPKGIFATLRLYPDNAVIESSISYFASSPTEWEVVHCVIAGLEDCGLIFQSNDPDFSERQPPHLLCVAAVHQQPLSYRSLCIFLQSFTDAIRLTLLKLPGSSAL